MNWFLAPIYTDPDTGGQGPGTGNPLTAHVVGGMRVHCYDFPGEQCLVGLPTAAPGDWTAQTLQQAKDHYETFLGVAPTNKQVF